MNMRQTFLRLLGILAVLAMLGAACSSSDDDSSTEGVDATAESDNDASADDDPAESSDGDAAVEAQDGGDLVIGRAEAMEGWDPDAALAMSTFQTLAVPYDTLLHWDPDGVSLAPGLAESWEYDAEALTYTFHLQPSAGFPDGTPVTSADVAFSVEYWRNGPVFGSFFLAVDSVEAPDDLTVVLHLNSADTFLPVAVTAANASVMQDDFGGLTAEEYFAAPVGPGPYQLESWSPGSEIVFTANENYWGGAPGPDRLIYKVFLDQDSMLLSFQNGDLDMVEFVQPDRAAQLDPSQQMVVSPAAGVVSMSPNHSEGHPTADVNVRRAISLAMNRTDLAAVYGGNAVPATGVVPCCISSSTGLVDGGDWTTFDLDAAADALAASSFPDGAELVLIFDNSKTLDAGIADVIQAQLGEIGLNVDVQGADTLTFVDRLYAADFDLAIGLMIPVSPSAGDPIGLYFATSFLFSFADMTALETALFSFVGAADEAERDAIVSALESAAFEDVSLIPMLSPDMIYAVGEGVTGLDLAPWGFYHPGTLDIEN